MLPDFWKKSAEKMLHPTEGNPVSNDGPVKVAIVGIGNEFNGDDAAGVLAARRLKARECAADAGHVVVIEAGVAPENVTAELRRFAPHIVILIDAAQMDAAPGAVNWIDWDSTTGMSASSHSLPLSMLARYLTLEIGCAVHLLGIQPVQTQAYTLPSPDIIDAVEGICAFFCQELFVSSR